MLCAAAVAMLGPIVVRIPNQSTSSEIQRLIDAGRSSQKPGQSLQINFPGREFFIDRTITLTGDNIVVRGSKATILSGAIPITNWRALSADETRFPKAQRQNIQVAEIPAGLPLGTLSRRGFGLSDRPSHSEVFADGRPLTLARFPNVDAPNGGWLATGATQGGRAFRDETNRPSQWNHPTEAWVYGYWHYDWADSTEPIEAYDAGSQTLKFGDPKDPNKGALGEFGLEKGRRYFYLNIPEELDQEGEYWVDAPNRRVYAWLPTGTKQVRLSLTDTPILRVDHTNGVDISQISLEGTRSSALKIDESRKVRFRDATIRNVGGSGASISGGDHSGLSNVDITGCGESGVALNGGSFDDLTPSENYVENCWIHGVSRWCRTYHPAVYLDGVGQRVIGNTLSDLPHNAILFGGNDHLIQNNDIRRVCLETGDSGAIYAGRNPTTRGTVIKNNRFREIEPRTNTEGNYAFVMSVYLDDNLCGISIIGNVFEAKGAAIMIGGGRDNVVTGNVFLNSQPSISFDQRGKGWAKNFFNGEWDYLKFLKQRPIDSPAWRAHYPTLARDVAAGDDLALAKGNVVAGNVQSGPRWIDYLDGLTVKDLDYRDNYTTTQPLDLAAAIRLIPAKYRTINLKVIGRRQ
jgi:hypothetical protein